MDSRQYEEDGSKRTRIRFMVEGPRGKMRVWAEVSDKLLEGYVFLICQDMQTGRVFTVVDNRDKLKLEAMSMGGAGQEGRNAMFALLGGSGSPSPKS